MPLTPERLSELRAMQFQQHGEWLKHPVTIEAIKILDEQIKTLDDFMQKKSMDFDTCSEGVRLAVAQYAALSRFRKQITLSQQFAEKTIKDIE